MFKKTKKIIFSVLCIIVVVCLFTVTVSASTYSIPHDKILTTETVLSVTNGKDYFKYYQPSLCNNYDDYSVCDWVIKGYNPPQDSEHNSLSTNIYLRLDQLNGIYVNKGQRVTISFDIAYDGTVDYDEYLTLRLKLQGWNTVSPRQYVGTLPKGSKTKVVFIWDNTIGECSIQYFDINFAIKNNKIINSDFFFEWFYGNLTVNVDEIPVNNQDIINNQNANADRIIQNQDQNTTAIIEHEENMYNQEKQEATDTGEDSVDDVMSAIPADNDGFISALEKLSSSLVTSSKTARWIFPRVYIPKIGGVINQEVELIPETRIDFNYWINKIPSNILSLIQVICTIALIIYCFKELYGTISYILTMRKGGDE